MPSPLSISNRRFPFLALSLTLLLAAVLPAIVAQDATPTADVAESKPQAEPPQADGFEGRVLDGEGLPVSGATVRVIRDGLSMWGGGRSNDDWVDPVLTTTDDDGTFSVTGLDAARYHLRCEAAGLAPHTQAFDPDGDDPIEIRLGSGLSLVGVALDAASGDALAGARVVACDEGAFKFGMGACQAVETDDEGRFAYAHLPEGELQIRVAAAAHAVGGPKKITLPLAKDAKPLEFRLGPGARMSGHVVDTEGRPVAHALLYTRSQSRSLSEMRRSGGGWAVASDDDGAFTFEGVPSGEGRTIGAQTRRMTGADAGPFTVTAGRDIKGIEIVLPEPARIELRLVDEDEIPVDGLEVYVRKAGSEQGAFSGPGRSLGDKSVVAGEDGRFSLLDLEPGEWDLLLMPAGFAEIERKDLRLAAGGTVDLGTLVVEAGREISGSITDSVGNPVEGAEINSAYRAVGGGIRTREVTSRKDGTYRLGGLGDSPVMWMQVSAKGFAQETRQNVDPGDTAVDFKLQRTGGVSGVVKHEDGSVPAAFIIESHREADRSQGLMNFGMRGRSKPETVSNPEGIFEVEGLTPGSYTLEIRARGKAPARKSSVVVVSDEITDVGTITVLDGITLRGKVTTLGDGLPLGGATVEARLSGGVLFNVASRDPDVIVCDENGAFAIEGLGAGTHRIKANHADYASAEERVEIEAGVEPNEIEIALGRGGALRGTVTDAQRQPVSGMRIMLMHGIMNMSDARFATTDSDGSYRFTRLAPGGYRAMRMAEGGFSNLDTKSVTIVEGETAVLDFNEEKAIALSGTVFRGIQPVTGASLIFVPSQGTVLATGMASAQSDASGRYEVGLDEPGSYRVLVQSSSSSGSQVEIDVPDASQVDLDILLSPAGISGMVVDPEGNPVAQATVMSVRSDAAADDFMAHHGAMSDARGHYSVEGLESGEYRVTATATGFRQSVHEVVSVGSLPVAGIDFQLQRGTSLRGRVVDGQGQGIPSAFVFAAKAGSLEAAGAASGQTDINGTFELTSPTDGPVDVTAIAAGWAPARLSAVTPSADPDAPGWELRVGTGGRLRVRVIGPEGQPLAGVQVQAVAVPPFLGSTVALMFSPPPPTDAQGLASIENLAPGGYEIKLPDRPEVPPVLAQVVEAVESPIEIRLSE